MTQYQKNYQGGGGKYDKPAIDSIKEADPEWLKEFTSKTLKWAEETGKSLQEGKVTTAQLRKFFGSVRRLEQEFFTEISEEEYTQIRLELLLMKPRLAYSAARAVSSGERKADEKTFKDFVKQVSVLLDEIAKADNKSLKSRYKTFVHILEAVVAYHKLNGGN